MSPTDMVTARARRDAVLAGYRDDETTARNLLSHESASVRASALAALARGKNLSDSDVSNALIDSDSIVRRRACALATQRPTIDLRPLLSDPDESVIEVAAWSLGEQGRTDAVDMLSELVYKHENALCRESAVAALGSIGDDTGLAAILHATNDKPAVRRRAIVSLAPFEGEDVTAALENARKDNDWQVRQAAEDLLDIDATISHMSETEPQGDEPETEEEVGVPHPDEEWPLKD